MKRKKKKPHISVGKKSNKIFEAGTIGVIGGVGLYEMPGLTDIREVRVKTPFGEPSDPFVIGRMGGRRLAFLARHGRGHRIPPGDINFRANIFGFKLLGTERIFSVSAVGSMREEIHPGDIVLPDQFFDRTAARPRTFFSREIVAHVALAHPVCPVMAGILARVGEEKGFRLHRQGTYICIEGPQFSTRAESDIYRQWGVSVIGMTNLPEARLAREAEICYATVAMVTDYDCWNEREGEVEIEDVIKVMKATIGKAKEMIAGAIPHLPEARNCVCSQALKDAIVTDPKAIPARLKKTLAPILKGVIK
ncbi:MAG: S-methyl-5'-thioadenosine phosphorylase [bacterium]|nr:S-methyl-5'-thioadenosine phosphorylase [bacterium]